MEPQKWCKFMELAAAGDQKPVAVRPSSVT